MWTFSLVFWSIGSHEKLLLWLTDLYLGWHYERFRWSHYERRVLWNESSMGRVEWIVWRESLLGRDVSKGATGMTTLAPRFSNAFNPIPTRGLGFCQLFARSHLNFSCIFVPAGLSNSAPEKMNEYSWVFPIHYMNVSTSTNELW